MTNFLDYDLVYSYSGLARKRSILDLAQYFSCVMSKHVWHIISINNYSYLKTYTPKPQDNKWNKKFSVPVLEDFEQYLQVKNVSYVVKAGFSDHLIVYLNWISVNPLVLTDVVSGTWLTVWYFTDNLISRINMLSSPLTILG